MQVMKSLNDQELIALYLTGETRAFPYLRFTKIKFTLPFTYS